MTSIDRRILLGGAGATATLITSPYVSRAVAAEFNFKAGPNQVASHPNNIRLKEAFDRILAESNGRLDIKLFPNSQLGGEADLLSQVRSGAVQISPSAASSSPRSFPSPRSMARPSRSRTMSRSGAPCTASSAPSSANTSPRPGSIRLPECGIQPHLGRLLGADQPARLGPPADRPAGARREASQPVRPGPAC